MAIDLEIPCFSARSSGCFSVHGNAVIHIRQVFWLPVHPTGCVFPTWRSVTWCNVRPRLQRRARPRFARGSLFSSMTSTWYVYFPKSGLAHPARPDQAAKGTCSCCPWTVMMRDGDDHRPYPAIIQAKKNPDRKIDPG